MVTDKQITNVNPHFGTLNDLINLVKTAHSMDIWVKIFK